MIQNKTASKAASYYLVFMALIILTFPSCSLSFQRAFTSLDASKQKEGGNSSDDPADVGYEPAQNLGYMVWYGILKGTSSPDLSLDPGNAFDNESKNTDWTLMMGLQYIGKGYKFNGTGSKAKIHLNYLEVPAYITYLHPSSSGSLFVGLGPYIAYGIGGKIKSDGFSIKSFGENNGGYKRFDLGLGASVGYLMNNGLSFHLSYEMGLANVVYASQDYTAKNRTISLNIGYDVSRFFKKD